jgi:hypothetical protein
MTPCKPLFYFFLVILVICIGGCSPHPIVKYKATALQLYNVNNGGDTPVDVTTSQVAAKAYAMRLEYSDVVVGNNSNEDEVDFVSANPTKTFMVYSLSDFDATHPARTLLNDYFLYSLYGTVVTSADSIQNQLALGQIATHPYTFGGPTAPNSWKSSDYLVLMHPPAILGTRSFVVDIGFADNTHISDTISVTLQ